jgi:hypothetical protein
LFFPELYVIVATNIIIKVIMTEHDEIGRTGDMGNLKRTLVGKFNGRDHLKNINLSGKIILIWILKK